MRKIFLIVFLLAGTSIAAPVIRAQSYQTPCPANNSVLPGGQTQNPSTGQLIAWLCVNNSTGQVTVQANTGAAPAVIFVSSLPATCTTGSYYAWKNFVYLCNSNTFTLQVTGLPTHGLQSIYLLNEGTGATLNDSSGNGITATMGGCGSGSPTWGASPQIGLVGAVQTSALCVNLPASLNTAKTIMVVTKFNASATNGNFFYSPISGNGGTAANTILFNHDTLGGDGTGVIGTAFNSALFLGSGSNLTPTTSLFDGTGTVTAVFDTASRFYYNATKTSGDCQAGLPPYTCNGGAQGNQTTGNYQLFGTSASQIGFGAATYYPGTIYAVITWTDVLQDDEVASFYNTALPILLAGRSIPFGVNQNTVNADQYQIVGDSIACGASGGLTQFGLQMKLSGAAVNTVINCASGYTLEGLNLAPIQFQLGTFSHPAASRNFALQQAITNSIAGGDSPATAAAALFQWAANCRTVVQVCAIGTMLDRGSLQTNEQAANLLIRQNAAAYGYIVVDFASDPVIGAANASANTNFFFGDATHPLQGAQTNDMAPIAEVNFDRAFGNKSSSTATTYTSGGSGAITVTAGSQSGNIISLTSTGWPAGEFAPGQRMACTGNTPSGYNSTYPGWFILSNTGTVVTAQIQTTGLGVITGFGTCTGAKAQNVDVFANIAMSSSGKTFTEESALGITGQTITRQNTGTFSYAETPWATETMNGVSSISVPPGATITCTSVLASTTAAGANWICAIGFGSASTTSPTFTSVTTSSQSGNLTSTNFVVLPSQSVVTFEGSINVTAGTAGATTITVCGVTSNSQIISGTGTINFIFPLAGTGSDFFGRCLASGTVTFTTSVTSPVALAYTATVKGVYNP